MTLYRTSRQVLVPVLCLLALGSAPSCRPAEAGPRQAVLLFYDSTRERDLLLEAAVRLELHKYKDRFAFWVADISEPDALKTLASYKRNPADVPLALVLEQARADSPVQEAIPLRQGDPRSAAAALVREIAVGRMVEVGPGLQYHGVWIDPSSPQQVRAVAPYCNLLLVTGEAAFRTALEADRQCVLYLPLVTANPEHARTALREAAQYVGDNLTDIVAVSIGENLLSSARVTPERLRDLAQLCRHHLPGVPLWVHDTLSAWQQHGAPDWADIVSTDIYLNRGPRLQDLPEASEHFLPKVDALIKAAPGKRLWVRLGCHAVKDRPDLGRFPTGWEMEWQYQLLRRRPQIEAVWWFAWPSDGAVEGFAGRPELEAIIRRHGQEFLTRREY